MPRNEGSRVTWHAVDYEKVDCATVLARGYFESVERPKRGLDVEDFLYIEGNEEKLFGEPNWKLEESQPSVIVNVRFSVPSALEDVKETCDARGISVLTDVCSVLSLTSQGVQQIVDFRSSEVPRVTALSEKDDTLRRVEAIGAERHDALQRVGIVYYLHAD